MKVVRFVASGQAALVDEPPPVVAPGRLLCRTTYSGLSNGTERNLLLGGCYCPGWPCGIGYQNVGEVVEVGPGLQGVEPGQRVFSGELASHAELFLADPAALTVLLPEGLDGREAALLGLAGIALYGLRRAAADRDDRVLVIGVGAIGRFSVRELVRRGAQVVVLDVEPTRLDAALRAGASDAVRMTDGGDWVAELVAQGPFTLCIEGSGTDVLARLLAARVLQFGARVVLLGGRAVVSYDFLAAQQAELTILHTRHFTRCDLDAALAGLVEGTLRPFPEPIRVVRIADASAEYRRLANDPCSLGWTVLDWTAAAKQATRTAGAVQVKPGDHRVYPNKGT